MQAQYGISLDAQQNQIAAYAKAYGYEISGFYVDHDSAKNTTGRPEYLKMIAEVDKGRAEFIISTALDRFSRSQRDFLAFQDEYVKTDKVHLVLISFQAAAGTNADPLKRGLTMHFCTRCSEKVNAAVQKIEAWRIFPGLA